MIKRTLYFGNPAYLSRRIEQLVVRLPEVEKNSDLPDSFKKEAEATIPIEDIGVVILDHKQIVITQALIDALLENNVALISCDETHHPAGLMLPLCGNKVQSERFNKQIAASEPLKKQLWQQTIKSKIRNQGSLLARNGTPVQNMIHWTEEVKSGDADNHEARAAAYYWANIFPEEFEFKRERYGDPPNNLLNYAYAILRAVVARALVAAGLLPTFGIHHHNRYNAYCLADDIMEPYRPYADSLVLELIQKGEAIYELNTKIKKHLLQLPAVDVFIDGGRSPLMVAMQRTTTSLVNCYVGETRKIIYPEFI